MRESFFSKSFLFKLLTVNARGFANPLTHNFLFDSIESSNCDVCFVQETLVSSESTIKSLSRRWLGRCFWSPACGRQGGVVTLISPKCSDEIVSWKKDSHGRIVSILIRSNGVDVNLVNIYAPTNLAERKIFFDSLHEFFIPSDAIIIGGDFNCYDNVLDKFGGNISIHKEYESLKNDFALVDVWRNLHPGSREFTWFNSSLSIGSRLDKFLVSRELLSPGVECNISPCPISNHDSWATLTYMLTCLRIWMPYNLEISWIQWACNNM